MRTAGHSTNDLQQRSSTVVSSKSVAKTVSGLEPKQSSSPPAADRPALAQLIEKHIIPRLMDDHGTGACALPAIPALDNDIVAFTDATLALEASVALDHFNGLIERGFAVDVLFERLLVPAALRLGEMWERDVRDFLDVARGMDHIQQIILAHSSAFCTEGKISDTSHRILLVTLPQERHRLGLCLVRADFWREGWDVCCGELQFMNDLEKLVRQTRYDAVGISAGRVGDAPMLARNLTRVRKASLNPDLLILTGGYAFQRDRNLSTAVGADIVADTGREAVAKLRQRLQNHDAALVR
jgi:MerR family transcriptional regulator, light-induced transcriptional regulator